MRQFGLYAINTLAGGIPCHQWNIYVDGLCKSQNNEKSNTVLELFELSIPQLIALISVAAYQVSGIGCVYSLSPPASQSKTNISMARYATGTATEIRPQWDSNPVLTSTFQQVAGRHLDRPKLSHATANRSILLCIPDWLAPFKAHSLAYRKS